MLHESLGLKPINVRLCGGISRKDLGILVEQDNDNGDANKRLVSPRGAPCSLPDCMASDRRPSYFATANGSTLALCDGLEGIVSQPACTSRGTVTMRSSSSLVPSDDGVVADYKPLGPVVLDPPKWAVPAKGETRLEPVCEATGRQCSVDLTRQACFRIGRSPNADVQLFHATSSRRHAMVFHHENGSCYIVDCGSAHGTFLNGKRISTPSIDGLSVPHKVRRGAMVRFGGPGAPCFILKSFSFCLNEIQESVRSLDAFDTIRRNTRVNALGVSAMSMIRSHQLSAASIEAALVGVSRKRSFDSLDSRDTIDEIPVDKRMRCSSPELMPPSPLRLVSPDLPAISKRRVTFSPQSPQVFFPTMDDVVATEQADAIAK